VPPLIYNNIHIAKGYLLAKVSKQMKNREYVVEMVSWCEPPRIFFGSACGIVALVSMNSVIRNIMHTVQKICYRLLWTAIDIEP
jgi:hypothetical protein